MVEHRSPKPGVAGSSPSTPANIFAVRQIQKLEEGGQWFYCVLETGHLENGTSGINKRSE